VALLTLKQAAKQLGITADTLRAQIRKERLRATKLGRDWLVEGAEVTRYERDSLGRPGRPSQRRVSSGVAMARISSRHVDTWLNSSTPTTKSVDDQTAFRGQTSIHLRLAPARSGRAAPEIGAAPTHRVERANEEPRTTGERKT
jgi:excisionase family DNA binding protein